MSIVHTFVCDYCGTQNHLSDDGDDYDGQEEMEEAENEKIASWGSGTASMSIAKSDDDLVMTLEDPPTLYYSVRLDFSAIKHYNPMRNIRKHVRNFSFCSKSCFGSFIDKNMDDKGKITKNKITEIK